MRLCDRNLLTPTLLKTAWSRYFAPARVGIGQYPPKMALVRYLALPASLPGKHPTEMALFPQITLTQLQFLLDASKQAPSASFRDFRLKTWEVLPPVGHQPPYSHWAFRGERDERWPLLQLPLPLPPKFRRRAAGLAPAGSPHPAHLQTQGPPVRRQAARREDDFEWMALMQHHGAPTRLIDFTWSPYVAAFFALERTLADGVVWAVNPARIDSSRAPRHKANGPAASKANSGVTS